MRSSVLACTGLLTLTLALTACSASAPPTDPDDEPYLVASRTDLETSLVDDPARYGVVLAGGIGMGGAHLVIDGSVLRFGDSLDLPRHESFPIDDAPEAYRAACPAVTGLIGIGP
ncbi:hypothetical protein ABIB37_002782 [Agrococcus sp. UYP10]|uniref:hypothetical protein n=1 Tax=Agrococcus sp. UYP10 TaxID=1756355 RepID=UPI003395B839